MIWHIHNSLGIRHLTHPELLAGISDGSIPTDSLLWTDGFSDWQPLLQIFPDSGPAESYLSRGRRRTRSLLVLATCVPAIAFASWYVAAGFDDAMRMLRPRLGLGPAIGMHLTLLGAIACLGCFFVVRLWRHPARHGSSPLAGLLLTLAACAALYETLNVASYAVVARDLYAIALSNEGMEDAKVTLVAPGTTSITGSIGPNLMRDFLDLEKRVGRIDAVEISSPGGLVEQALRLAEHVKSRKLRVVAQEECLSACILVAVASPHSYATPGTLFGFHRTSPVTKLTSPVANFGVEQMGSQSRAFLRSHKIPERVLEEAGKHGPDSVYIVPADDMVAFGAIRATVPMGYFRAKP